MSGLLDDLFDPADGTQPDHPAAPKALSVELLVNVFNARGVIAEDHWCGIFNRSDDCPGLPFQRGLAPAI